MKKKPFQRIMKYMMEYKTFILPSEITRFHQAKNLKRKTINFYTNQKKSQL